MKKNIKYIGFGVIFIVVVIFFLLQINKESTLPTSNQKIWSVNNVNELITALNQVSPDDKVVIAKGIYNLQEIEIPDSLPRITLKGDGYSKSIIYLNQPLESESLALKKLTLVQVNQFATIDSPNLTITESLIVAPMGNFNFGIRVGGDGRTFFIKNSIFQGNGISINAWPYENFSENAVIEDNIFLGQISCAIDISIDFFFKHLPKKDQVAVYEEYAKTLETKNIFINVKSSVCGGKG